MLRVAIAPTGTNVGAHYYILWHQCWGLSYSNFFSVYCSMLLTLILRVKMCLKIKKALQLITDWACPPRSMCEGPSGPCPIIAINKLPALSLPTSPAQPMGPSWWICLASPLLAWLYHLFSFLPPSIYLFVSFFKYFISVMTLLGTAHLHILSKPLKLPKYANLIQVLKFLKTMLAKDRNVQNSPKLAGFIITPLLIILIIAYFWS